MHLGALFPMPNAAAISGTLANLGVNQPVKRDA